MSLVAGQHKQYKIENFCFCCRPKERKGKEKRKEKRLVPGNQTQEKEEKVEKKKKDSTIEHTFVFGG